MDEVILTAEEIRKTLKNGYTTDGKDVIIDGHKFIVSWELFDEEEE